MFELLPQGLHRPLSAFQIRFAAVLSHCGCAGRVFAACVVLVGEGYSFCAYSRRLYYLLLVVSPLRRIPRTLVPLPPHLVIRPLFSRTPPRFRPCSHIFRFCAVPAAIQSLMLCIHCGGPLAFHLYFLIAEFERVDDSFIRTLFWSASPSSNFIASHHCLLRPSLRSFPLLACLLVPLFLFFSLWSQGLSSPRRSRLRKSLMSYF